MSNRCSIDIAGSIFEWEQTKNNFFVASSAKMTDSHVHQKAVAIRLDRNGRADAMTRGLHGAIKAGCDDAERILAETRAQFHRSRPSTQFNAVPIARRLESF